MTFDRHARDPEPGNGAEGGRCAARCHRPWTVRVDRDRVPGDRIRAERVRDDKHRGIDAIGQVCVCRVLFRGTGGIAEIPGPGIRVVGGEIRELNSAGTGEQ